MILLRGDTMSQRTLIFVKPDGVARRLSGEIMSRFERKGLRIIGLKMMKISRELAEKHYAVHKGKPFYNDLIDFITSGPIVAMVLEGPDAVDLSRILIGATNPLQSTPGSIRGDFCLQTQQNLVHGSDSTENAEREIALFFREEELIAD